MHFLSLWRKDFRYFLKKHVGRLSENSGVTRLVDALIDEQKTSFLKGNFWMQLRKHDPDLLARNIYERLLPTDRSLSEIFKAIIEEACLIRGYRKCMVKFPVYVSQMDFLRQCYPKAPIVHITRDPRAIAASKTNDPGGVGKFIKQHPWMEPSLRMAALLFVVMQYNLAARTHQKHSGQHHYQLFYYEDLLANPEKVIAELCEFAELIWSESMLDPKSGQPSSLTGQRRSGFDPNAASRWKDVLSNREVRFIEFMTKSAQAKYGFHRR
jgi:hypothetical protein